MNYTPQAEDVIESPNSRKRIRIRGAAAGGGCDTITYRRKWWFWGPWGCLFGFQMSYLQCDTATSWGLSNLVDDHGWTLVSRKEVQDGK